MSKNYVFDIDGTICTNTNGVYELAKPLKSRINIVNSLYEQGNKIVYFTARGMGRNNNNPEKAKEQFYKFTEKQLTLWGVKYHQLLLGKPSADVYVDDKAIRDDQFFEIQSFE